MKERFIENNIEYILAKGGMYYPNLQLPEDIETRSVGLYGLLRKTFLKEHRPVLYMHFVLSGSLTTHLADTNKVAQERMDILMRQMAQTQGVTEQLKSTDQMAWVRAMNNIQSTAREIVLSELIYI